MKYYIIADGGGTKLHAVLYDESFRIISEASTAGTNANFRDPAQIEADVEAMAAALLPDGIDSVEACDACIVGDARLLESALKKHCGIREFSHYGEGVAALAAAGEVYGAVAQAGTGSDAFLIQRNLTDIVGGWGSMLGDEGSGYDIGIRSMKAAIYAFDGRGPETLLLELIMKKWELTHPWDMIGRLCGSSDYRRLAASVSFLTEQAADRNDAVALGIFEHAAHEMSHQMLTLLARHGGFFKGPIVTSGGAWKGSARMFDTFACDIHAVYPDAEVRYPVFEPIIGLAVLRKFNNGCEKDSFWQAMNESFGKYKYKHK